MEIIKNCRIITPFRLIDGDIGMESGKIVEIGRGLSGRVLFDAHGAFASPGFVDIHTHGAGGADFTDGSPEAFLTASAMQARHGATTVLPTTLTCSDDELFALFRAYDEAKVISRRASENGKPVGANMPGLHLEGPYFAPAQCGAQDTRYIVPPNPAQYMKILDAEPDIIRFSAAPELPGALELGDELRKRGILASIGHTDAVSDDVFAAFERGFTHVTHLYSCMTTVTRRGGFRFPGVIEAAYALEGMTVELIADGCHLPPLMLREAYLRKGAWRTCLVTDSMRGAGLGDGPSVIGSLAHGSPVIIEDGVAKLPDRSAFAGSVATCDRLVRNMRALGGATLEDAVAMMTATPARVAGLRTKGFLAPGYDADIAVFDDNIDILATFISGNIYDSGAAL